MNQSFDDEQVEQLLKNLPKAPPMSKIDIKRFEKQIDGLVASETNPHQRKNWIPTLSAVASVAILIAGFAIFSGGSSKLSTAIPGIGASQSPAPNVSSPGDVGSGNSSGTTQNDESSGQTVYGQSPTPKPGANRTSVPVLRSNLDYSSSLNEARKKTTLQAVKGNLEALSSSQLSCSVKLGIDHQLWAIDIGTYQGEDIEAYYFGETASNLLVKIVGYGCTLITEL